MGRDSHQTSDILEAVALLVVDMQDGFLKVIPDAEAVVARCAFAIEAAREFGIRIVFTEQAPDKLGPTHPGLLAAAGNDARVFAKNTFSALAADGLQQHLKKLGVYHVLICGIEAPVCIYQTALHANDSELDVTVLSDCVAGRRIDDCFVALRAIAAAHCHVLPAETVFYSMLGSSDNRHFPAFTKLVKHFSDPAVVVPRPSSPSRQRNEEAQPQQRPQRREQPPAVRPPEPERETRRSERVVETAPESVADAPTQDDTEPATDGDTDSETASAEGAPKKRPRRRRGGVRRRRSRERAAGETSEGGGSAPAPESSDGGEPA